MLCCCLPLFVFRCICKFVFCVFVFLCFRCASPKLLTIAKSEAPKNTKTQKLLNGLHHLANQFHVTFPMPAIQSRNILLTGAHFFFPVKWNSVARVVCTIVRIFPADIPAPGITVIRSPACSTNFCSKKRPSSAVAFWPELSTRL